MGRGWGHRNGDEKHLVFSETGSNPAAGSASHRGGAPSPAFSTPTAFRCQAIARIMATS
jgi:hypothetical protein